MATKLNKKLLRESNIIIDDREVMVTLTPDQRIELKLKGLKSGSVSIDILDLWNQLSDNGKNNGSVSIEEVNSKSKIKKDPMISLNDLRSHNAISGLDYPIVVKFEEIIKNLMDNYHEKYGKYIKNENL